MRRVFFFLLIFFCSAFAEEHFILIYQMKGQKSYFSYLAGKNNQRYFLKQPLFNYVEDRFNLILDTLGCTIAEESGLLFNHVSLIPADENHIGKFVEERAATFHTEAVGRSLEKKGPFYNLDLRQKSPVRAHISQKEWGLTRKNIRAMTLHPDLPQILAIDTFLGNCDRSVENLFYDETTNRFCGIDMDRIFSGALSRFALMQIQPLIEKNKLSNKEKEALIAYREKLISLQKQFPPEEIENRMRVLLEQLNDETNKPLVENQLRSHCKKFAENYEETTQLISVLNRL